VLIGRLNHRPDDTSEGEDVGQARYSLEGRIALVTGASSGWARLARLYAAAGAAVVLGARRVERTQALADAIKGAGGRALSVAMDVTDEGSIVAAFDAAEAAFGAPDVVLAMPVWPKRVVRSILNLSA
jgi:enoyl-[acyl-carrier-protein] reductase (NADH)